MRKKVIKSIQSFIHKKRRETAGLSETISIVFVKSLVTGLLLFMAAFMVFDQLVFRSSFEKDLDILMDMTSRFVHADVSEANVRSLKNRLDSLKEFQYLRYIAVMDREGHLITEHKRHWLTGIKRLDTDGEQYLKQLEKEGYAVLQSPLYQNGLYIGRLIGIFDQKIYFTRLQQLLSLGVFFFMLSLLIGVLSSKRKLKSLTRPLLGLVNISEKVGQSQDFSLRMEGSDVTEFNRLSHNFNNMLDTLDRNEKAVRRSEERLQLALKSSGEGLWEWDLRSSKVFIDQFSNSILKFSPPKYSIPVELFEKSVYLEDRSRVLKRLDRIAQGELLSYSDEFRLVLESREVIWVRINGKIAEYDGLRAARIAGTIQDITDRKHHEKNLLLYASVFNNTRDAVVIMNEHFEMLASNHAFTILTGLAQSELMGISNFPFLARIDRDRQLEWLKNRISRQSYWKGEGVAENMEGKSFPIELEINTVKSGDEGQTHYLAIFADISERKLMEQDLRNSAHYDNMTGLVNRSFFQELLSKAIARGSRRGILMAILFIDLNKFKQVNDTLGHKFGDALLREVSNRLLEIVRKSDVVARLAGDEFVVLLEDVHSVRDVEGIAKKVVEMLDTPFELHGKTVYSGCSVGISLFPENGSDIEMLLQYADVAMYSAKALGISNYKFYNSEMNSKANFRAMIEKDLADAIKKNQLEVYFQPKINTQTQEVVGFEALMRWRHPEHGWITPATFIPIAEDCGLILQLGEWVLKASCNTLKKWHDEGFDHLTIAINVSPKQFQLQEFPIFVAEIFSHLDLDPKFVEFEITESVIMDNPDKMTLMLKTLKLMGFTLSIDDFGTGYSSLTYLSQFSLDVLKIDQSFVKDMLVSEDISLITSAIVSLAHNLRLKVVAEGVETAEQLAHLNRLGCEVSQGYYISKPLADAEVLPFIQSYQPRAADASKSAS